MAGLLLSKSNLGSLNTTTLLESACAATIVLNATQKATKTSAIIFFTLLRYTTNLNKGKYSN
jgi:hypothetical protein